MSGFDILYSLQDYEFDRKWGLKSVPVCFGQNPALWISRVLHLIAVLVWVGAGRLAGLGGIYEGGLALAAFFLLLEHWLIGRFGIAKIQQAFFNMNVGVSFTLFVAAVADLQLR